MRIFKHPNLTGNWKCPLCGTSEDKEVILVAIQGTENGRNVQAEQIHVDCIDLTWSREDGAIFMFLSDDIWAKTKPKF